MIEKFLRWLHWKLIERCDHSNAIYDVLERGVRPDADKPPVSWCRSCGAVSVQYTENNEWRLPRPDWEEP